MTNQADPAQPITQNTAIASPNYALHRTGVAAVDPVVAAGNLDNPKEGINMQGYLRANVQVLPSTLADPTVEILFWSPGANRFIAPETPITAGPAGANVPYEFSFDVNGRLFLVRLSVLGGSGASDIYVSGSEMDHLR